MPSFGAGTGEGTWVCPQGATSRCWSRAQCGQAHCQAGTVIADVTGPQGNTRGSLPRGELTLPQSHPHLSRCLGLQMNPPSLTQGVHWASLISTHSASSQPTMLRVPVLETPNGTCLAPQVLEDWHEMAGHAGLFPLTDMSTSTELKGLFRKDECWALGKGAGWPQSSSLPVPRARLCGPALRGLRAWWLLDPGCSLLHQRSHRLALGNPCACDSPAGT